MDPCHTQQCPAWSVRRSPDDAECTVIQYDRAKQLVHRPDEIETLNNERGLPHLLHASRQSRDPRQEAPLELKPYEPLRLRIFLDRSILEIFVNDRQCMTHASTPRVPTPWACSLRRRRPRLGQLLGSRDMAPTNPW